MDRVAIGCAIALSSLLCACTAAGPQPTPAAANAQVTATPATPTGVPPTSNPQLAQSLVGTSTPISITHDTAGVPLPVAPGAMNSRVVTWTPIPTIPPGATPAPRILSGQVKVDAGDQYFIPSDIVATVGTTVDWTNVGEDTHNVVARDGSFDSKDLSPGQHFMFTFTVPGLYDYICTYHYGNGMFGSVKVVESNTPQAPASD